MDDLDALLDYHRPYTPPFSGNEYCRACEAVWPCDIGALALVVRGLRDRLEQLEPPDSGD